MNQATLEKMQQMKLCGMARAFRTALETGMQEQFTTDELVSHLAQAEWDERNNRKLDRLINNAKFRYQASVEETDFKPLRNLDKNMIFRFADGDWLRKGENIIVTGATGTGKSFIACALGHSACIQGFRVFYANCLKLFSELKYAQADGTYIRRIKALQKTDLIILDDFGLKKFDAQSRLMLLELMEDRHGVKSTIISSQLPVNNWFEIIGDQTIADAVCDRLVHNAYKIELKGDSMRKKKSRDS